MSRLILEDEDGSAIILRRRCDDIEINLMTLFFDDEMICLWNTLFFTLLENRLTCFLPNRLEWQADDRRHFQV